MKTGAILFALLLAATPVFAGDGDTVILFGDLHSHSSNSLDAALLHLPVVGGGGFRGPDMHCEFARYCADLDFWSINDHAEQQTIEQWNENVEAVRRCQERYGSPEDGRPLESFIGWEWTQVGDTIENSYGHRNVVLKDLDDVVPRPMSAPTKFADQDPLMFRVLALLLTFADRPNAGMYEQILRTVVDGGKRPDCDPDVNTRELPPGCREVAQTPVDLAGRLAAWNVDALVIPHGTTWGSFHVPGAGWQDMFERGMHDPSTGMLVEIDSGHGNGERYKPWRHTIVNAGGSLACPAPTADFEPCCWRAGEIARSRSGKCRRDPDGEACRQVVEKARQAYVDAGINGQKTIRADAGEWGGCGECLDCEQPANLYRPMASVQAALAAGSFDGPENPWAYPFGFVGSTDSHRAGPGAGYKEFREMSDAYLPTNAAAKPIIRLAGETVTPDFQRQQSYLYAGSLAAVHAKERSRDAIWEALRNRHTYATSGDRIELWFDFVSEDAALPMGSDAVADAAPTFRVRAKGAFKQVDGCPQSVKDEMSMDFIEDVCFGECYYPTGRRYRIVRIELVKITPRLTPDEPTGAMIHDPFATYVCAVEGDECTATFTDPSFLEEGRAAAYYARVYQEPTPRFNADNLRCVAGESGPCEKTLPCLYGFHEKVDDCMSDAPELAWSSPIFVRPAAVNSD